MIIIRDNAYFMQQDFYKVLIYAKYARLCRLTNFNCTDTCFVISLAKGHRYNYITFTDITAG